MGNIVCAGATLKCSFGAAPSVLSVLPTNQLMTTTPIANIMDNKPMLNIPPFGLCQSMSNPTVSAATAAKFGVFTPMPCVPVTSAPWFPGSATVLIANMPALNNSSKCLCNWGGVIEVVHPGQINIQVP